MKQVNTEEFKELLDNSDKPLLVDFWADWCAPCRMIKPILEDLSNDEELKEKIEFIGVDVEHNNQLAAQYAITSIPSVLLIHPDKGKIMESIGLVQKDALKEKIKDALENH